ncbi:Nn.00g046330.m01.CDS01 [Neocucurbitaria sp. VM-36]
MSERSILRPQVDPAYKVAGGYPGVADILDVELFRRMGDTTTAEGVLAKHPNLTHTNITVPAVEEFVDNAITLATFQTKSSSNRKRSALLYIHGGGQVLGNRYHCVEQFLSLVCPIDDNIVFVSIEYRRAPEHPAPAGAYDCYASLVYLAEHATEMGIDSSKILVYGLSGGASLAAATCMLARKLKGPQISAQMLHVPMLDDRDHWASTQQFETGTLWPGKINRQAWDMVLGHDRSGSDVDYLRAPGRSTDLSNLPSAFIDVGNCEVFRDSAVAFASQIWKSGGSAELHVWPGMYHGAALIEPDVPISQAALAAQRSFIKRVFSARR